RAPRSAPARRPRRRPAWWTGSLRRPGCGPWAADRSGPALLDLDHLGPVHRAHPRTVLLGTALTLDLLQQRPAVEADPVRAALGHQRLEILAPLDRAVDQAGGHVLAQRGHGVAGAFLVGAQKARGSALDPAGGVDARQRLIGVGVYH